MSFVAFESFCQVNKINQAFTNVYHPYKNHILVSNSDGTNSTIYVNGGSATLVNSDGTQSTIDLNKNFSTLIAVDGTRPLVYHNGLSSVIIKSDGTQIVVSHMASSSSCSSENENNTITHSYGHTRRRRSTAGIDVLIHLNWLMKNKANEANQEFNNEEVNGEE